MTRKRDLAAEAEVKRKYRAAHPKEKVPRETYWTPEREADLRRDVEVEGLTIRQIAVKWGTTKNAISGKLMRLGVEPVNARGPIIQGKLRALNILGITTIERLDAIDRFPAAGHCLFADGDTRKTGLTFCGEPVANSGEPFCAEHRARCWVPVTSSTSRLVKYNPEIAPAKAEAA